MLTLSSAPARYHRAIFAFKILFNNRFSRASVLEASSTISLFNSHVDRTPHSGALEARECHILL